MTSQTAAESIFEMHLEIMHQYILKPDILPTNKSPEWVIKFSGINGGIEIEAVKGSFSCYNFSFIFDRNLVGQDTVGAGLKGRGVFILQNDQKTPLMQRLSEKIFSNKVFETISAVRLMDLEEKNLRDVFVMNKAKISKLQSNNDLICGEILCEQLNITDFEINDSGESSGKVVAGYDFVTGRVTT